MEQSATGTIRAPMPRNRASLRPPTSRPVVVGWAFGIVLPMLCLVADPGVLRASGFGMGPPLLGSHAAAVYALVFPAMALLAVWLHRRKGGIFVAGPLLAGGVLAVAVGIALLPWSIPLSLVGIGLLGLVPFGTALVYFGNGLSALREARARHAAARAYLVAGVLGLAAVGLPLAAQASVDRRAREVLQAAQSGDAARQARAVAALRTFGWLADSSAVFDAWRYADPQVQERIERAWYDATGQELAALVD